MEPPETATRLRTLFIFIFALLFSKMGHATHAQGADLTYTCLGNGEYELRVSFYRDCEGIDAPNSITVDASSDQCNEDLDVTLDQVQGTGQDVTPICDADSTECNGGSNPGVEEYVYTGTVTLPQQCPDWNFDFSVCCRNNAITTIDDPNNEEIHLNAQLDNQNYPCNNSPSFSNPPVPYICVGETYCFNHGAQDPDGDSLSYSLVTPTSGQNGSTVTYKNGYSAQQPLNSSPSVSIDPVTGDICMTPTQQDVTVMQVQVKEWRNGQVIGTINRDIQVQVIPCSNNLPYLSGIDGSGDYQMDVCAGENVYFEIPSFDADSSQDLTLSWDQGIASGQFDAGQGMRPTANFQWTPGWQHVGNGPHCFTVEVEDDNCPLNGSQVYSFCLTVHGIDSLDLSSSPANCGASNGKASVDTVYGASGPFDYQWTPNKGNAQSANYNGIPADTYTVQVTDPYGCTAEDSITVGPGSLPGNLSVTSTPPSCDGGSDGTATVQVQGGKGPYQYSWSNGDSTQTADSLSAGSYYVDVFTSDGCHSSDTVTIQDPAALTLSLDSLSMPLCHGDSNGYAAVSANGGTAPYDFQWSGLPQQNSSQTNQLYAGQHTVTVVDANGCTEQVSFTMNEPAPLTSSISTKNVDCYGGTSGSATVTGKGGTAPYQYDWQGTGSQQATLSNVPAGQYVVEVSDQNGCTNYDTAHIGQPAPLSVDTLGITPVTCHGGEDGSISVAVNGGTAPYNYNWSNINQSGPQVSGLQAATYILEVTDANGCAILDSFQVQEPAPLQVQVGQIFDVSCHNGSDGMATASASGGTGPYSFTWDLDSPQTGKSAFGLSAGNYSVMVTDAEGCQATTNFQVGEPAPIEVQLTPVADTICPGDSVDLNASASGGNGQYIYVWSQGLGTGASHTVAPSQSTDYDVIAYDTSGCASSERTVEIAVRRLDRKAFGTKGGDPVCHGEMASISAYYSKEGGGISFQWDQGIGTGSGPHHVLPGDTTTYSVTVSDQCQNQLVDSVIVPVHPEPPVDVEVDDAEACGEASVVCRNDTTRDVNTELEWEFSTGASSTVEEPTLEFSNSGQHTAKLVLTNQYGCMNSGKDDFSVKVHPMPSADFEVSPDRKVSIMEPEARFHYNDPHAIEWAFAFGDGDSSQKRDPVHRYDEVGTYPVTLTARTLHGCEAQHTEEFVVEDRFTYYVPNAFSPDGDGKNDEFDGKGAGYTARKMMIFNRWGELIFESTDPDVDWDGTVKGEKVKPDVYVYKIKVKDHKGNWHEKKGHVTVVR